MTKEDVSWTLTHPLFIFSYSFLISHFIVFVISNLSFVITNYFTINLAALPAPLMTYMPEGRTAEAFPQPLLTS